MSQENKSLYTEIEELQKNIREAQEKIKLLREKIKPEIVQNYFFKNKKNEAVSLLECFRENSDYLLVIHNMGKKCSYCTLWADELNGISTPLYDAVPFVLISPDTPEVQEEFATSRNWKFNMLSAHETSFIADMGFEPKPNQYYPGVSVFKKQGDAILRTSFDYFGPGDMYCGLWHYLDLIPEKLDWHPKIKYA